MKLFTPQQRAWWDLLTYVLVIVSAFEIPYGVLVGYEDPHRELLFDIGFSVVFSMDIVLNCMTVQEERFGGLFDWRAVAGIVCPRWSPRAKQLEAGRAARSIQAQPDAARSYLLSGWFLIDLLAAIPWSVLAAGGASSALGMSRSLRLLRTTRLLRLLRARRGFRSIEVLRRVIRMHPAVRRLLITIILLPWLAHFTACVLVVVERGNDQTPIATYSDAFYHVGMMFIAGEPISDLTSSGRVIGVFGVILSLMFIGTLIANLTSLLARIDSVRGSGANEPHAGHTIVLGFDASIYGILEQLTTEDGSRYGGDADRCEVVIIADQRPEQVWQAIGAHCPSVAQHEVYVHRGDFTSPAVLKRFRVHDARQVIILGQESKPGDSSHEMSDVRALKAILACCKAVNAGRGQVVQDIYGESSSREGLPMGHTIPIVATVGSSMSAKILADGIPITVSAHVSVHVVNTLEMVGRILAQVIVQPKLAAVYLDLMSYELDGEQGGAEFYCVPLPGAAAGLRFDEVAEGFTRAIAIGYMAAGNTVLNPLPRTAEAMKALVVGDRVVVVARSPEDTVWERRPTTVTMEAERRATAQDEPRRVLVVGMGSGVRSLVGRLMEFLPAGSSISTWEDVVDAGNAADVEIYRLSLPRAGLEGGDPRLIHLIASLEEGVPRVVDTIVLMPAAEDRALHDAEVLLSLAALQAASFRKRGARIVVDLLDSANRDMAEVFDDPVVVVSTKMVGDYIVQLADDPLRGSVFQALTGGAHGSEIYVRSALEYLPRDGGQMNFAEIMGVARGRREIAIGYISREGGVVLSPPDWNVPLTCTLVTDIVVVAEE